MRIEPVICTSTGLAKVRAACRRRRRARARTSRRSRRRRRRTGRRGGNRPDSATPTGCRARRSAARRDSCGVERQQHRNRAASDAGEDRRGDRVQLHQRRRRTRIPIGARRWLAKVKAETTAGWLLISVRSWSSTARHSTRTAEIEGVRNSSAEAPVAQIGRRPGPSKQKAASQRVSKRTAFVPNASPPGACPLSDPGA